MIITIWFEKGKMYINGVQKAPCIVAKARYVLGLTVDKPTNKNSCSNIYYRLIVKVLGIIHNLPITTIENALQNNIYLQ